MSFWKNLFGSKIKTVTIGNQEWMQRNLDADHLRNGDLIAHAKTNEVWQIMGDNEQPAWCYFNNDPENGKKYGKLYNWYAINDPRGLSPVGFHITSEPDWKKLIDFLGDNTIANEIMNSSSILDYSNAKYNSIGFTDFPLGGRKFDGSFFSIGPVLVSFWWS